jgi:hypothetical protein
MQAENCINAALGRQVFKWAMLRSGLEPEPSDVVLLDHIRDCPACHELVGQWKRKAEAARVLTEGDRVLSGDIRPDERVDERRSREGRVLFKYFEREPNLGMLLLVGLDGRITSVNARASRGEFEMASVIQSNHVE